MNGTVHSFTGFSFILFELYLCYFCSDSCINFDCEYNNMTTSTCAIAETNIRIYVYPFRLLTASVFRGCINQLLAEVFGADNSLIVERIVFGQMCTRISHFSNQSTVSPVIVKP